MQYQRVTLTTGVPMDVYIPHISQQINPQVQRPGIVICPGGGYVHLSEREAEPIAMKFLAMGFNCFVLWYRLAPEHRYPAPQQDVASAVAWVRQHTAETHTGPDQIAVMGFSAGGHCAGSLGVWWPKAELWQPLGLTPEDVRPNAMVLCYPVISGGEFAHRGSFESLSGTADLAAHTAYSLEESVTEQTPPTFLWHTWEDGAVPVQNTLMMASALRAHNVPAEVHIFPKGGHGIALANDLTTSVAYPEQNVPECVIWPELAGRFLKQLLPGVLPLDPA
ncbi:MAG: alpha/beta hydrolase [Clostridia bacterium]|nr:alpha/beta hydrolase [Clostridia bacterium]